MTFLTTLLHFADGSRRREEDPITEIFAYILKTRGEIRTAFVEKIRQRICDVTVPKLGDPVIATQVSVPAVDGGTCRYDLVLAWGALRLEIVVEIKVRAGLTWKRIEDEEGGTTNIHQRSSTPKGPWSWMPSHDYRGRSPTRGGRTTPASGRLSGRARAL